MTRKTTGKAGLICCCLMLGITQAAMAIGNIVVMRNQLRQTYPQIPEYDQLTNEVLVSDTQVTFLSNVRAYDGTSSTTYFIYTLSSTAQPLTVRYGGSNPGSKNICISIRYDLSSAAWQPFSPVDIDLSSCGSSQVFQSYIGPPGDETPSWWSEVSQLKVNGACSFRVRGDVTGPVDCDSTTGIVVIKQLTSTGSLTFNSNTGAVTVGQPVYTPEQYWGPQQCDGSIYCTGDMSGASIKIYGTLNGGITLAGGSGTISAPVINGIITIPGDFTGRIEANGLTPSTIPKQLVHRIVWLDSEESADFRSCDDSVSCRQGHESVSLVGQQRCCTEHHAELDGWRLRDHTSDSLWNDQFTSVSS